MFFDLILSHGTLETILKYLNYDDKKVYIFYDLLKQTNQIIIIYNKKDNKIPKKNIYLCFCIL